MSKQLSILAIVMLLNACVDTLRNDKTSAELIRTNEGYIQGKADGDISIYVGVPYASPPVGKFRWRSPQPPKTWKGVRQATDYAAPCMQHIDPRSPPRKYSPPPNEDCLYLNIWAPPHQKKKLPVMVWIYGGGFGSGLTTYEMFDGTALAKRGVLVVSIAYRTGAFGFLAHPELSKESGHGSGNYGLEDQIAALQWIQKNISAFGGDPNRVTIFGQSAGGISVSMLAASPLASGLFQRVISQSGGNFAPKRKSQDEAGMQMTDLAESEQIGIQALNSIGVSSIATARKLPPEQVMEAKIFWWPNFDGYVLPGDQYNIYVNGRQNDTPILIGTNSDDGYVFEWQSSPTQFESKIRDGFGPFADALIEAYPHDNASRALDSARDLFRDITFAWPTWTWARLQSRTGTNPVYLYYFNHDVPHQRDSFLAGARGASHNDDIRYVFGNLGENDNLKEADYNLSNLMMSYWVNFARTGNPNGDNLPIWPVFTESTQQLMQLNEHSKVISVPNLSQLKILDDYYAWRRSQR